MQILKADKLFSNIGEINTIDLEDIESINIDFSNISTIDFKAMKALLAMQKVAILNNKNFSLSNVNPKIKKMLEVTGLNKTFSQNVTNPILKVQ